MDSTSRSMRKTVTLCCVLANYVVVRSRTTVGAPRNSGAFYRGGVKTPTLIRSRSSVGTLSAPRASNATPRTARPAIKDSEKTCSHFDSPLSSINSIAEAGSSTFDRHEHNHTGKKCLGLQKELPEGFSSIVEEAYDEFFLLNLHTCGWGST
jgi:hypothetical protein